MIPRLTTRGKLVLTSVLMFLLVGALHGVPSVVGFGAIALAVLTACYISFYPTAILLRRKKIELSWWVAPGDLPGGAVAVDRPFELHLAYRNHGSRRLRILSTRIFTTSGLVVDDRPKASVPRGHQVELAVMVKPIACGPQVFHGAALVLGDILALFDIEAYFPNPIPATVFPRTVPADGITATRVVGTAHERAGLHMVKRRGVSGDLRELREHAHGDPFKVIAWKATAKRGRLMVRDLETEIVQHQVLLIDTGPSMRGGAPGKTPLDWTIDTATSLARASLARGDRVGVVAFDTRVLAELPSATGPNHALAITHKLIDLRPTVDEDVTDLTAGELAGLVAQYLAHHESIDTRVRVAPPIDDPRWNHIQAGPDGQLYDVGAMVKLTEKLIQVSRHTPVGGTPILRKAIPKAHDADRAMAALRRFCRVRGIELPYRRGWEHGRRTAGLEAAVERAIAHGKPDSIVLFSDLAGLTEDEAALTRIAARVRSRAGSVTAVVPAPWLFLPPVASEDGARARRVVELEQRAVHARAKALLQRRGVKLRVAGPGVALHRRAG